MFFPILLEITKGQEKEKKGLEWEIKGGKGEESGVGMSQTR